MWDDSDNLESAVSLKAFNKYEHGYLFDIHAKSSKKILDN
jgi:hypothetical protein